MGVYVDAKSHNTNRTRTTTTISPTETKSSSTSDTPTISETSATPTQSASDSRSTTISETGTETSPTPSSSESASGKTISETDSATSMTRSQSESSSSTISSESNSLTISLGNTSTKTITPTKSASSSSSPTPTKSPSITETESASATETITATHTLWTLTKTKTLTKSGSPSKSVSDSKTPSQTPTSSGSSSTSPSRSKSKDTPSASKTETSSVTVSESPTATASESNTSTVSSSETASDSESDTITSSVSATLVSYTATRTKSETRTPSPTQSESSTQSTSPSKTSSPTPSKSPSTTMTRTASDSISESATSSESSSQSGTTSRSPTPSVSETISPSLTQSLSLSGSLSSSLSVTADQSASITISATFSPSQSASLSKSSSRTASTSSSSSESRSISISFSLSASPTGDISATNSLPLTTSVIPPTTTPIPTASRSFMTYCPANCFNGVCNNKYPFRCICYSSAIKGYWSGSEFFGPCDKCRPGFWGPRCDQACQGGACGRCGGHGTCDQGKDGTGICTCYNSSVEGFWEMSASQTCSRCQQNTYGLNCQNTCPCSSHGKCFDGRSGNGTCQCIDVGWSGPNCDVCDPTKVTTGCAAVVTCPLDCSGNGVCVGAAASSSSSSSTGQCQCFRNFAGSGCEIICQGMLYDTPIIGQNVSCNARSTCNDGSSGDGTCKKPCGGNFNGSDCASCNFGYWGNTTTSSCTSICPGGASAPCNNSGTCNQETGICECSGSYGGTNCDVPCPVGANGLPCSGNGLCSSTTATCICFQDPTTRGFWNGTTCGRCNDDHRGASCTIQCPMLNGKICNNNGTCNYDGKCDCTYPACGRVCDTDWNGTRCNSCPVDGFYGLSCNKPCLCVHGNCSMGKNGDGSCECELGYAGPYCNVTCPLGPGPSTCGGAGICLQSDATCFCDKGYAGPNCTLKCPDVNCSGNGHCRDGASGDGVCACFPNFAGSNCSTKCNNCGSHGTCPGNGNSTCICFGNFTGTQCDSCKLGLSGPFCNLTCYNGVTNGTNCSCTGDWVMPQCNAKCPADPFTSLTCGGPTKGICDATTAVCSCISPLINRGPACSCTTSDCQTRYGTASAICDDTTGQCKCSGNLIGLSSGCKSCAAGFWSKDCTTTCECNSHGTCAISTGACSCFADEANGFWAGVTCSTCLSGYMGELCQQKAVSITVLTSIAYQETLTRQTQYTLPDDNTSLYYVGADALNLVYNVASTIPALIENIVVVVSSSSSSSTTKTARVDKFVRAACVNQTKGGDGGNIGGLFKFSASEMTSLTTDPSDQLMYLFHQNTTCPDIPIRAYMGPASPLSNFIANRSRVIDNLLPFGLVLFSFLFTEISVACAISSSSQLACQYVVVPPLTSSFVTDSVLVTSVTFNVLRHAARTPSATRSSSSTNNNNQRIVMSGADSASRCSIQFLNISKTAPSPSSPLGTLSYTSAVSLHDVYSEMLNIHKWQCKTIDSFYETKSGVLVYAAFADKGCYIGAFTTNVQSPADVVVYNGAKVSSNLYQGRGIVYDEESGIGIAVFNQLAIKFRIGVNSTTGIPTIEPYGQQILAVSNIFKMDYFASQQVVYAPRSQAKGVEILRFLLLDVLSLSPDIADRRGGATIIVTGRGYRNVSTAVCRFGSSSQTSAAATAAAATYISPTKVSCVVPFAASTDTCLSQAVEVSMTGLFFTQNNVMLNRPKDVTITGLSPVAVRHLTPNIVVHLFGRGFINNSAAKCKLLINGTTNLNFFHTYSAKYVSPVQYDCIVPVAATMTFPGSYVTLALDGQIFSTSSAPHSVVGPAAGVICSPSKLSGGTKQLSVPSNSSSNSSAAATSLVGIEFPPWPTVYVRDTNQNLLGSFDNQLHRTATINATAGFTISIPATVTPYPFVLTNGTGTLAGYRVPNPIVGIRPTIITVDGKWSCSFLTEITSGDLSQLRIKSQPVTPTDILLPRGLLPQTTEIYTLDEADNVVPGNVFGGSTNIILNASLARFDPVTGVANVSYSPQGQVQVRDNGIASLSPFQVKLIFGVQYAVYFVVAENAKIHTFTNRFTPTCDSARYQVHGEGTCRDCPAEAVCNGSTIMTNRAGFWRLNNQTTTFLACPIPSACPAGTPNTYGASVCAPGYRGILCADCVNDFGKDSSGSCGACPSFGTQVGILIILVVFIFIVLFTVTLLAVQNNPVPTSSLGRAVVLIGLLFTTLQTISLMSYLGIDWGSGMSVVLNICAFLFEFRITALRAVDCLFRGVSGMNTSHNFVFFLFLISVVLLVPTILLVKLTVKLSPSLLLSSDAKKNRDKIQEVAKRSYTGREGPENKTKETFVKEHQFYIIVLSAAQVFLFFLMQIDIYYLLAILSCTDVPFQEPYDESFSSQKQLERFRLLRVMTIDTRVDCDSPQFTTIKGFVITFAAIVCMCCTFGIYVAVGYFRFRRHEDDFEAACSFLFMGLTLRRWFWSVVILTKKLLLVLIVSFLKYPIGLYCFMWVNMVCAWLEFDLKPYTDQDFNQLSMVFNFVIIVVVNIGMTLRVVYEVSEDGTPIHQILDIAAVAIIVASILLFSWKCSKMFVARYIRERNEERREIVEDVDEKAVEMELQKRYDEEVQAQKSRKEDEMDTIEKIRKELRVKALAERKRSSNNNTNSQDEEIDQVAKDFRNDRRTVNSRRHVDDQFSAILDEFQGAAEDEERQKVERQSRGAEDVASWSASAKHYLDDVDDNEDAYNNRNKHNNERNSDTRSIVSAASSSSNNLPSLGMKRHNKKNKQTAAELAPQTTYIPGRNNDNKHNNLTTTKNSIIRDDKSRHEVEDAIDSFLSGGNSNNNNGNFSSPLGSAFDDAYDDDDNDDLFMTNNNSAEGDAMKKKQLKKRTDEEQDLFTAIMKDRPDFNAHEKFIQQKQLAPPVPVQMKSPMVINHHNIRVDTSTTSTKSNNNADTDISNVNPFLRNALSPPPPLTIPLPNSPNNNVNTHHKRSTASSSSSPSGSPTQHHIPSFLLKVKERNIDKDDVDRSGFSPSSPPPSSVMHPEFDEDDL